MAGSDKGKKPARKKGAPAPKTRPPEGPDNRTDPIKRVMTLGGSTLSDLDGAVERLFSPPGVTLLLLAAAALYFLFGP